MGRSSAGGQKAKHQRGGVAHGAQAAPPHSRTPCGSGPLTPCLSFPARPLIYNQLLSRPGCPEFPASLQSPACHVNAVSTGVTIQWPLGGKLGGIGQWRGFFRGRDGAGGWPVDDRARDAPHCAADLCRPGTRQGIQNLALAPGGFGPGGIRPGEFLDPGESLPGVVMVLLVVVMPWRSCCSPIPSLPGVPFLRTSPALPRNPAELSLVLFPSALPGVLVARGPHFAAAAPRSAPSELPARTGFTRGSARRESLVHSR